MHVRKLFAVAAVCLSFASAAVAQTDASAPSQPQGGTAKDEKAPAKKKTRKSKKGSKATKTSKSSKKKRRSKKRQPTVEAYGPVSSDVDPPQLTVTPVSHANRGKLLTINAHAQDPSGIFGPVLYVRKKGLGASDYVPIKMTPSKIVPNEYSADVPAALMKIDGLDYYVEAWDTVGNGPARVGSADAPLTVSVDEPKAIVVVPPPPEVKPKGAPPSIMHTALTQSLKGKPIEVNARVSGESGVQGATVMFRHVGEKDYRSLPMGNLGADEYTATIPAAMATADIEYYVEAFDKYGNGPARSGAPNLPYTTKLTDAVPPPVAAPARVAAKEPIEPEPEPTYVGIGIDGGLPGGGGLTLLVRPLWWLRLNAGLAYNVAGLGYRGVITLSPGQWAVTPTLSFDAGRYVSGDATKIFTISNTNFRAVATNLPYTFATAQAGLEFGSQRRFVFYIRGGLTYLMGKIAGAPLAGAVQGGISDPSIAVNSADVKTTAVLPCASLGFNIFVY
jgi:hypothetical protein